MGIPREIVLGPILFMLYKRIWYGLENMLAVMGTNLILSNILLVLREAYLDHSQMKFDTQSHMFKINAPNFHVTSGCGGVATFILFLTADKSICLLQ